MAILLRSMSGLLLSFLSCLVATAHAKPDFNQPHLADFRLGVSGITQKSGGMGIAPELAWNPNLTLTSFLSLRGDIRLATFMDRSTTFFFSLEYQLVLALFLDNSFAIEAGAGKADWGKYGGKAYMFSANLAIPLRNSPLPPSWERVFFGYSALIFPNYTNQLTLGISFYL